MHYIAPDPNEVLECFFHGSREGKACLFSVLRLLRNQSGGGRLEARNNAPKCASHGRRVIARLGVAQASRNVEGERFAAASFLARLAACLKVMRAEGVSKTDVFEVRVGKRLYISSVMSIGTSTSPFLFQNRILHVLWVATQHFGSTCRV